MELSCCAGEPKSLRGSAARNLYDEGVRMGSLAMILYSVSSTIYSYFIPSLINRLGKWLAVSVCKDILLISFLSVSFVLKAHLYMINL